MNYQKSETTYKSNGNFTIKALSYQACEDCGEYCMNVVRLRDRVTGDEEVAEQCIKCGSLRVPSNSKWAN